MCRRKYCDDLNRFPSAVLCVSFPIIHRIALMRNVFLVLLQKIFSNNRIKRKPMLGFQSFRSADKTLKRIEAMNMIKKGQVNDLNYSVLNEVKYINQLFGIVL